MDIAATGRGAGGGVVSSSDRFFRFCLVTAKKGLVEFHRQGCGIHICCVLRSLSVVKIKSKVNWKYPLRSTVKPLNLFEVLGQG